jgi:purine-cytosine permease-like protein
MKWKFQLQYPHKQSMHFAFACTSPEQTLMYIIIITCMRYCLLIHNYIKHIIDSSSYCNYILCGWLIKDYFFNINKCKNMNQNQHF